jgi:hypothetical protein
MLKWLMGRRASATPVREKPRTAPSVRRPAAARVSPAAPPAAAPADAVLPEVVAEGNTQADWSAWEDSMAAWDSQLQDLAPAQRIRVRDGRARPQEIDPFAGVAAKRR